MAVNVLSMDTRTNSNFALCNNNRLIFITELEGVHCKARTETLYRTDIFGI